MSGDVGTLLVGVLGSAAVLVAVVLVAALIGNLRRTARVLRYLLDAVEKLTKEVEALRSGATERTPPPSVPTPEPTGDDAASRGAARSTSEHRALRTESGPHSAH